MANNVYDAIVIGSGITGGWAAKELTERGLKTIMLERGRNIEHIKDYPSPNKDPWDFPHRGRCHWIAPSTTYLLELKING